MVPAGFLKNAEGLIHEVSASKNLRSSSEWYVTHRELLFFGGVRRVDRPRVVRLRAFLRKGFNRCGAFLPLWFTLMRPFPIAWVPPVGKPLRA